MHVMGSVTQFSDMGLFQEGLCPPSAPSAIRATDPPSPPASLAPPPPPLLAPPPPPPPPPPPLLPPPLLPGLGGPTEGLRRNKSVRKFFWKTIPEHQVKGRTNLWTQGPAEQHQIDVQTIEELFGHDDCRSNSKAPPTRAGRGRASFRETKEEVCILDGKRGMNIGIFLKQFKRPNQAIVEDIRGGNSEPYGAEPLRELLKLLPESDEVKKLKAFRGDVAKLSLADSFVYLLLQLPSYVLRIESMLLKEEFPVECEAMKRDIKILRSATKELMCCEELHAVLHLVLQAGNILNAGGYAGNAVGFKLSSLPSLADTKANKPGMNLLHFVALEAQKKNERLLEFPLKLSHVQAASRISLETLDSELQKLVCRTRSIEESVQRDTELLQQLDAFLQSAMSALCSLRGARQQLKRESEELLDFFCEDKDTFRLDDCFNIFNSFCLKFAAAVKDNAERERKEAARRRRLQELEEQKRHSWAGGEQIGAFGFRSSSELDMNSALSRNDEAGLLMELLMPKSHPRSPLLRRSGSFRRTRISSEVEVRTSEPKDTEKKDGSISLQDTNKQKTPQNTLNTDTDYLRNNSRRAKTSTSTSDLNNNGKEGCKDKTGKKDELNHDFSNKIIDKSHCNASNMSVILEKCTLVPELKAFDKVSIPTHSKTQNDVVVTDFEEANVSKDTEKVHSLVKKEEEISDTVIVWCVTGVCEVENGQTDQNDSQDVMTINSTNDMASNQQTANQNTVPISSQPMPTTRFIDITVTAFETKMDSEVEGRDVATNQKEGMEGDVTNQETESQEKVLEMVVDDQDKVLEDHNAKVSTNQKPESQSYAIENDHEKVEEVSEKLQDSEAKQNTDSSTNGNPESQRSVLKKEVCTEQKGEVVSEKLQDSNATQNAKSSTNAKTENLPKRVPSSKATGGNKSVRTLTTTESHNMRRVVPISRPNSAKLPDKPPGSQRGTSALSVPNRSAPRRLERPSTAPTSRRSSLNKTENQEQDANKKMAVKKTTQEKKKTQQEEKMCRSTLRSINQNEEKRGIMSAPATPIHNTKTTPGFARNTASSSFRRTNTSLTKNSTSSTVASSQSSTNSSPKVSRKMSSPKLSPKSLDRQSLTNSSVASSLNAASLPLSKISSPKILSPKFSPTSNLKNIQNSNSANTESVAYSKAKVLSPNMSPQNSSNSNLASPKMPSPRRNSANNLSNSSPKNALLKTSSANLAARSSTSGLTNAENLASGASADLTPCQSSKNSNLQSPKISVNSVSNKAATHKLANSTSSNTETSTNSNLASPKLASFSTNASVQKITPHMSNTAPSENIANCSSPETSSQNVATKSSTSNFIDPNLQDSINSNSNLASIHDSNLASPKLSSSNESLNLNNNLDITCPQNSSSHMSSPSNLTSPTLQNTRNNNLDLARDSATSALSSFTDANCSEKSTKPQKNSSLSNSQNSNLTSSGSSANCPPKILSPKATSRLTLTNSLSRNSTNSNSNLTQNSSPKSPKLASPSYRTGSFRVSPPSPKTPDLGLKRSLSARAPPRSLLLPDAASTGRRRKDSGNFSDKSAQLTKESRPTWR